MNPGRSAGEAHKTDFTNPAEVAVEVTEVKGQLALLQQQVSQALSNVSSQLGALQGDLRDVQKELRAVAAQQHDIQSHSTGLERLAKVLETHIDANHAWQRAHAAENQIVADRVTLWRGVVICFVALGGMLTTAGIYFVQNSFERADAELARVEALHTSDVNRLERTIERNQADIRELQQAKVRQP